MKVVLRNKNLLIFLLCVGLIVQYGFNQKLKEEQKIYEQKMENTFQHLVMTSDYKEFSEILEQVSEANQAEFANLFIKAEQLSQQFTDRFLHLNNLRDVAGAPNQKYGLGYNNDLYYPFTKEQANLQDKIVQSSLSGFFHSLKQKYYYFDEELQPEDKKVLKDLSVQIAKLNNELEYMRQHLSRFPDGIQTAMHRFDHLGSYFDAIHEILRNYQGEKEVPPKLSEKEAISIAKKRLKIPDSFNVQVQLKNSSLSSIYGNSGVSIFELHFNKESGSSDDYVVEVDAINGLIVSYYDAIVGYKKDHYYGKGWTPELKNIVMEVADQEIDEIKQPKRIILQNVTKHSPEETDAWVIGETHGMLDFTKVISLTINATERKAFRYSRFWTEVQLSDVQPKLSKGELTMKLKQNYQFEQTQIADPLVITYSYFRKQPVLTYVVNHKDKYHLVNADTGRIETSYSKEFHGFHQVFQTYF